MNISCILAAKILRESVDGADVILDAVNRYNAVLDDYIIPGVFHALFDITAELKTEDKELVLLREPKEAGYYEFSAKDDLVITIVIPALPRTKSRKVSMLIPTASILSQRKNVLCSISPVEKSKKYTSQECLPPIREIFPCIIMTRNRAESANTIRTSWQK